MELFRETSACSLLSSAWRTWARGDFEVLDVGALDEGIETVLGDEQVAEGLADAELGLCDLGECGGDLGFVSALLGEGELGLGDFVGDGRLFELDGLRHSAGRRGSSLSDHIRSGPGGR